MARLRTRVLRMDGKLIYVAQKRAHLFVCAKGCCCGRTDRGHAAVPVDFYKDEYKRRRLRARMQLSMNGCLGPCSMANAVLLVFDGRPIWLQSINEAPQIAAVFDYVESMFAADRYLPPPAELAEYVFDYYLWSSPNCEVQAAPPEPSLTEVEQTGICILSHADTDLLSLHHAARSLPLDFVPVQVVSLGKVKSEEHMQSLLAGPVRGARIVVVRLLGGLASLPGFDRLRESVQRRQQCLIVVSGLGSLDPELSAASTVPPAVAHQVAAYLLAGGRENAANLLRFLSDHVLLTGLGYEPAQPQPQHGIYHPDIPTPTSLAAWRARHPAAKPVVGLLFYRAHWMSGNLAFVDAFVREIEARGCHALPVFTASLKDLAANAGSRPSASSSDSQQAAPPSPDWPAAFEFFWHEGRPLADVVINTMSFNMGDVNAGGPTQAGWAIDALRALDVPILQAIACGTARWQWEASARGLNPLDTAMNVALPEFDGRVITVPVTFKERLRDTAAGRSGGDVFEYVPAADRIAAVASQAARWAALRRKPNPEKRVAFVLTNAPGKAARIGNAVGLDTPASLLRIFAALREAGYGLEDVPSDGDTLIQSLIDRCSYDETFLSDEQLAAAAGHVAVDDYQRWFQELPEKQRQRMQAQWGPPPGEAYVHAGAIALAGLDLGNVFLALQPPRGYGMDRNAIYHQPDLPPPHNYYALYRWLRDVWQADAIVHVGKHGTLEWLPGKSVGMSAECFPESFLGDLPLIYPFIMNNPGEGAQAKRRAHAVLVDHLVPAMTAAENYGPMAELAQLVDEYYQLEMFDPAKLPLLQQQIWDLIRAAHLDEDLKQLMRQDHGDHVHDWDDATTPEGTPVTLAALQGREFAHLVEDLDGYLCELAGAQIRDGLHILGELPPDEQLAGLLAALVRVPNLDVPSLRSGIAENFGLDLDLLLDAPGQRLTAEPVSLAQIAERALVTHSDALEAIDALGQRLIAFLQRHDFAPSQIDAAIASVLPTPDSPLPIDATLSFVCTRLVPALRHTPDEIGNLLHALAGGYVPAGPSGAPTRGMAHVLPTGRNFYAVDPRAMPSLAAWQIGQELAREVLARHRAETGRWPETIGISVWGTSAMRTHGDDVAQVFALLGVRPVWQRENRRLAGVEVIPLAELGRPRIDVVVRISGFFRDGFPNLIRLMNEAVEMVVGLDEPAEQNFVRQHYLDDIERRMSEGLDDCETQSDARARYRVFGSKPGAYGAGILPLIEEGNWREQADLAEAYVNWGGYAYTGENEGIDAREAFRDRLATVQVAVHNQDNREHDIFDSDDYLQYHGGMIATIRSLTGRQPRHYFGDTHVPGRPVVRDLKEEALRVFRSRVVNPKWLSGITRHGYKGGLELAATVDYLFGFDATAGVVDDWMYAQVAQSYALDAAMQEFLRQSNPWALHAISERLLEAAQRELWAEPSPEVLAALRATLCASEALLEERSERTAVAASRERKSHDLSPGI